MNSLTKNEITVESNEKASIKNQSSTTINVSNQIFNNSLNNSNQNDKKNENSIFDSYFEKLSSNSLNKENFIQIQNEILFKIRENIRNKNKIFLSVEILNLLSNLNLKFNLILDFIKLLILINNKDKDEYIINQFHLIINFNENLNEFKDFEDSLFILTDYLYRNLQTENFNFNSKIFNYLQKTIYVKIFTLFPIFSLLLHTLSKNSNLPQIKILLSEMTKNHLEISTCAINNYIDCLCKNNFLEECQTLFEELITYKPSLIFPYNSYNFSKYIPGIGINIVSFGTFIKYLCKSNNFELALYYYDILNEKNLLKDEIIFNLILDGCSKKTDINTLKKVYYDMLNKNIKPTIVTFNTIIDAYIRNKDIQSAWKIFEDLIKNEITPDNFTLSTLFRGIRLPIHKEYLYKGFELINKNDNIDIILINVLLDSCIKLKEEKMLIELFDKVIERKINNVKPDLITFNTFIKGCAQLNLYDKVTNAFETLMKTDIKPNDVTFNTLIDVFVRQKKMDQVWTIISNMKKYGIKPDNFTYSTVIKGLNKNCIKDENDNNNNNNENNELELAFKLFENVKKNSKPDEILHNCIMDACLRFDKIDLMLELYDNMLNEGIKPSSITCGIVIKAYGMKKNISKAIEIYQNMKKEKIEISSVTYGCLINACIKNNNLNKAFELYEELKKNGYEMNTVLYTTLIKAYSKIKNINKVIEIFNTMKESKNNLPNNITYNSVIDCCLKCNLYDLANKIFNEMINNNNYNNKNIKPDIITFSTLIKGEIRRKKFQNALNYLNIMFNLNIFPDEILLNSLLDGCEKCNEFKKAYYIFNLFKTKNVEPTMMSYSIMMKITGKINDFEYSTVLLNEVKNKIKNLNLIIFTCYIKTCFNCGKIQIAIETFNSLKKYKINPDEICYSTMINGITNFNNNNNFCDDVINICLESINKGISLKRRCYINIIKYLKKNKVFEKIKPFTNILEEKGLLEPISNNEKKEFNNNNNKNIDDNYEDKNNENVFNNNKKNRNPLGELWTKNNNYYYNNKIYSNNNNNNNNKYSTSQKYNNYNNNNNNNYNNNNININKIFNEKQNYAPFYPKYYKQYNNVNNNHISYNNNNY